MTGTDAQNLYGYVPYVCPCGRIGKPVKESLDFKENASLMQAGLFGCLTARLAKVMSKKKSFITLTAAHAFIFLN